MGIFQKGGNSRYFQPRARPRNASRSNTVGTISCGVSSKGKTEIIYSLISPAAPPFLSNSIEVPGILYKYKDEQRGKNRMKSYLKPRLK